MKTKIGPKTTPEFLDNKIYPKDFAVRHPVNIMTDGGSNRTELQDGSYVDVLIKRCPKWGVCIIYNVHFIDADGAHDVTFSWSGADTHMYYFGVGYIPVRGSLNYPKDSGTSLCYVEDSNQWVLTLGASCSWMIGSGLKEGMTKDEVANAFGGDVPGKFIDGKQYGKLKQYSFDSYAMEKEYHLDGDYHYNATTKDYLDLYFDQNGKLDRWCTNF